MSIISKIMFWLFGGWEEEYYHRYIAPQVERAKALGMTHNEIDQIIEYSIKAADPTVIGLAPGSIMRDYLDAYEAQKAGDL